MHLPKPKRMTTPVFARLGQGLLAATLLCLLAAGCAQPKGADSAQDLGVRLYEAVKARNTMALEDLMLSQEAAAQTLENAQVADSKRAEAEASLESDVREIREKLMQEFVVLQAFAKDVKLDWSASGLHRIKEDSHEEEDGVTFTDLEIIVRHKGRSFSIFATGIKAGDRWYLVEGLQLVPIDA